MGYNKYYMYKKILQAESEVLKVKLLMVFQDQVLYSLFTAHLS